MCQILGAADLTWAWLRDTSLPIPCCSVAQAKASLPRLCFSSLVFISLPLNEFSTHWYTWWAQCVAATQGTWVFFSVSSFSLQMTFLISLSFHHIIWLSVWFKSFGLLPSFSPLPQATIWSLGSSLTSVSVSPSEYPRCRVSLCSSGPVFILTYLRITWLFSC